jgi:hypothetical protein
VQVKGVFSFSGIFAKSQNKTIRMKRSCSIVGLPSPTVHASPRGVKCVCTVHCARTLHLDLSQSRVKKASCVMTTHKLIVARSRGSQHNRANSHHSPVMGISGMIPETPCKCSSPPLSGACRLPLPAHHTHGLHTRTTSPLSPRPPPHHPPPPPLHHHDCYDISHPRRRPLRGCRAEAAVTPALS